MDKEDVDYGSNQHHVKKKNTISSYLISVV